jgi:hypothetical protein
VISHKSNQHTLIGPDGAIATVRDPDKVFANLSDARDRALAPPDSGQVTQQITPLLALAGYLGPAAGGD